MTADHQANWSGCNSRTCGAISIVFMACAAFAAIYAVASVVFFGIFGGFLTYPLLALVAAAPKGATLDRALLMRLSRHVPVIDVRV